MLVMKLPKSKMILLSKLTIGKSKFTLNSGFSFESFSAMSICEIDFYANAFVQYVCSIKSEVNSIRIVRSFYYRLTVTKIEPVEN